MSTCDVIIPTKDGQEKLHLVILSLLEQEIPEGWTVRVIISDDGSKKPIVISGYVWAGSWVPPIVIRNLHKGRSYARNSAINVATADIILFLADDILVRPGALRQHLLFHTQHKELAASALGCVVWDPRVRPTPLMDWMMHGGQQNDYDAITGVITCNAQNYFYGSFVSVKREFLGSMRFSEIFSEYGWEDLELGARLQAKGLVLHVLHGALALHAHKYTASEIVQRQRIVGSARYLVNTDTVRIFVHGVYEVLGIRLLAIFCMQTWGDTLNTPRFFARVTAGEFWYGVHHANKLLIRKKRIMA